MQDLVLGTAQWGSAYGVTNAVGRISDDSVAQIVAVAQHLGVRLIDTASGYGDAEERLRPWARELAVFTKVRASGGLSVPAQLRASLGRLGLEKVRSCLLHDWSSLSTAEAEEAVGQLRQAQEEGLVELVGVSAYDESDVVRALTVFGTLGCVQVPASAVDRRLDHSPVMLTLMESGTEIQLRSVFLQGLLARRSGTGLGLHPEIVRFHDECERAGVRPLQAALAYAQSREWVTQVVVGATSATELRQIADAWAAPGAWYPEPPAAIDFDLIDPRRWA